MHLLMVLDHRSLRAPVPTVLGAEDGQVLAAAATLTVVAHGLAADLQTLDVLVDHIGHDALAGLVLAGAHELFFFDRNLTNAMRTTPVRVTVAPSVVRRSAAAST
ncbi:MAG: hypothetical protein V4550_18230 [Gemmatimonadota bacterium]